MSKKARNLKRCWRNVVQEGAVDLDILSQFLQKPPGITWKIWPGLLEKSQLVFYGFSGEKIPYCSWFGSMMVGDLFGWFPVTMIHCWAWGFWLIYDGWSNPNLELFSNGTPKSSMFLWDLYGKPWNVQHPKYLWVPWLWKPKDIILGFRLVWYWHLPHIHMCHSHIWDDVETHRQNPHTARSQRLKTPVAGLKIPKDNYSSFSHNFTYVVYRYIYIYLYSYVVCVYDMYIYMNHIWYIYVYIYMWCMSCDSLSDVPRPQAHWLAWRHWCVLPHCVFWFLGFRCHNTLIICTLWWTFTFCHGKSPCYSWENPLFLWPCSIAFCMFTRG